MYQRRRSPDSPPSLSSPLLPRSPVGARKDGSEDFFVINLSGARFEATRATLSSVGGSRLAELARRGKDDPSYRAAHADYFFERHPEAFESVLHFHRMGKLHAQRGLCGSLLKQELKFWGIEDSLVEQCCWGEYIESVEKPSQYDKLEKHFEVLSSGLLQRSVNCSNETSRWRKRLDKLELAFNRPSLSVLGKVLMATFAVFTVASVAIVVAESCLWYWNDVTSLAESSDSQSSAVDGNGTRLSAATNLKRQSNGNVVHSEPTLSSGGSSSGIAEVEHALHRVNVILFAYFLLDFVTRLAVAADKPRSLASAMRIVELLCLLAHGVIVAGGFVSPHDSNSGGAAAEAAAGDSYRRAVHYLGVLMVLRVARLLQHSDMARVLAYTVLTSLRELGVVLVCIGSIVFVFACLAHYVEPESFTSVARGCWWSLITLTTIGYGDVYPKTAAGQLVGSLCALVGVFVLAFTVPLVVSNFNVYYGHVRARKQWRQKCERVKQAKAFWKDLPLLPKAMPANNAAHA